MLAKSDATTNDLSADELLSLAEQGADIDVKHVEGGSVLTEFSGEGWADLIKQVSRPGARRARVGRGSGLLCVW